MNEQWGVNGLAIASMIISIFSILMCCVPIFGLLTGVTSLVLGIMGYRSANPRQKDAAIAGIVVGAVGTALAIAIEIMSVMIQSTVKDWPM